jgi:hypothetical protein
MTPEAQLAPEPPAVEDTAAPARAPELAPNASAEPSKSSGGEQAKKPKQEKKKGAKGKGAKAGEDAGADPNAPSVAAHPRAARAVGQAKGWGALGGFLIGGYLSLPTATLADAGLRALLAGVVCYVAAWAGAVFVWRRLVMIELKGREQQLRAGHGPD